MRPTDFYLATATLSGSNFSRTSTVAFHDLAARTLMFAPSLAVPTVTELPGTYKRLQVAVGALSQTYNQSISLQYGDVRGSIAVSATRDYFDASTGALAAPDLSAVPGGRPISGFRVRERGVSWPKGRRRSGRRVSRAG